MLNTDSRAEDTAAILTELEGESHGVESTFMSAADALIDGRAHLVALTNTLGSYRDGLSDLSGTSIADSVATMARRFAQARTSYGTERDAVVRIGVLLEGTRVPLWQLREHIHTLEIFTSTARVVEVEFGGDDDLAFSQQIRRLSESSRAGYEDLRRLHDRMTEQVADIRSGQEGFGDSAVAQFTTLEQNLTAMSDKVAPGLARAGRDARHIAEAVDRLAKRMSQAIAAMQVGDSFRQRIEHASEGLRGDPAVPLTPAARDLVDLIVAAQLSASGRVLDHDLRRIAGTMSAISGETSGLVHWAGSLLRDSEIAALLQTLQDVCGASLAALYSSQAERRTLDARLRALRDTVADTRQVMTEQAQVNAQMKLGSYNVSLRSQRGGGGSSAMTYVARQIGELIDDCLSARQNIVERLDATGEAIDAVMARTEGQVSGELDTVGARLRGLSGMLGLWRALGTSLEQLTLDGPAAVAAFTRCAEQMVAQQDLARRVMSFAGALHAHLPQRDGTVLMRDPAAAEAAARLRTLYSVPEERDIHDSFCPPDTPAAPSPQDRAAAEEEEKFEWF
jgi:hypothetical protein